MSGRSGPEPEPLSDRAMFLAFYAEAPNRVTAAVPVQAGPEDQFYSCMQQQNDGLMWARGAGPKLYGIDPKTNRVTKTLPVADRFDTRGMDWDVKLLPSFQDRVTWVDARSGKPVMSLQVAYAKPTDVFVIFSADRAWIIDNGDNSLREIDLKEKRVVRIISLGGPVGQPVFAVGSLWLPVFDANVLWTVKPF